MLVAFNDNRVTTTVMTRLLVLGRRGRRWALILIAPHTLAFPLQKHLLQGRTLRPSRRGCGCWSREHQTVIETASAASTPAADPLSRVDTDFCCAEQVGIVDRCGLCRGLLPSPAVLNKGKETSTRRRTHNSLYVFINWTLEVQSTCGIRTINVQ